MKISDEMVGDACQAAYGPVWSFVDAEAMRAAIEAVAPAIRAQALEEAAREEYSRTRAAQRMAFETTSAPENKAAAIRVAKETAK